MFQNIFLTLNEKPIQITLQLIQNIKMIYKVKLFLDLKLAFYNQNRESIKNQIPTSLI